MYAELSGPLHKMLQVGKFDGWKGSKKKLAWTPEAEDETTPPSLFLGQRIQRKLEFLSKILYRQVHWCAALFCRTSPERAKIPQNRPNFRVFNFFGQNSGRWTPPPILGA